MEAIDIVGLLVPVTYFVMLGIELVWPARKFPARRGWYWLGIAFLVLIGTAGATIPMLLPIDWLEAHRWLPGNRLGIAGGTLAGWLVLSGIGFVWHRSSHAFSFLWRFGHQVHHSPQRIDISGSTLFHPLEICVQTLLQLFVTAIVLGLDPLAAALVGYVAAFHGMFQHWNVRTPRWLGYFIQRPEAHCVHHTLNVHAYNYGDCPIWDLLFGTFRNPKSFEGDVGFEAPADKKLLAMFAWRDVNAPALGAQNLGRLQL